MTSAIQVTCCLTLVLLWPLHLPGAEATFEPIPATQQNLYKFDFRRWYYADEAARQADLTKLRMIGEQLTALRPTASQNAEALLGSLNRLEEMGIIADRLQSFGGLRLSVNTVDSTAATEAEEGENAWNEMRGHYAFLEGAVQSLPEDTLRIFQKQVPGLLVYSQLMKGWRRNSAHSAGEAVEPVLAQLSSRMDPFRGDFYRLLIARTSNATIVANGETLNVTTPSEYAQILRIHDRDVRKGGFELWINAYKNQGDLYAYGLFEKARTAMPLLPSGISKTPWMPSFLKSTLSQALWTQS